MDSLPELHWAGRTWRLPMTAVARESLVDLLLSESESDRLAAAERAIRADETLAGWVAFRSRSNRDSGPSAGCAKRLAEQLARNGASWLQWDDASSGPDCELHELLAAANGKVDFAAPLSTDQAAEPGDSSVDAGPRLISRLARLVARIESLERDFGRRLEEEKLSALRELAYGASHEINNPLANISTRAQSLLRDERDVERRRKLATINAQAFRAHEMIADMMLFAKPPRMQPQEIDVIEMLAQVVSEMSAEAAEQQTELRLVATETERLIATADPNYLVEALRALIRNSLEALQASGWVEVSARSERKDEHRGVEGRWLCLCVRDNGPGISEETRRHLFDPYFSGREAGRGLGLGLAKCWTIARQHGGTVDVDSRVGHGTTMTIRVPFQESLASAGINQGTM